MAYVEQKMKSVQHGAALAIAGLLQATVLMGLVEGLEMRGPPQLPSQPKWPIRWVTVPLPPPCFDCELGDPPPPEPMLKHPPKPNNAPSRWLTDADYPTFDRRQGNQGRTAFSLDIDSRGKVIACRITASSGFAGLDETTCRQILLRARFKPATDDAGRAVSGIYVGSVRWIVPQPRRQ